MQDPQFVSSLNDLNNTLTFYHIDSGAVSAEMLLVSGLQQMYGDSDANHTGLDSDMMFETVPLSTATYLRYLEDLRLLLVSTDWSPSIAHSADSVRALCYHTGVWAQAINYNNTEVNGWYESALAEADPVVQSLYYDLIQKSVANDSPYVWASQRTEFRTTREWLIGQGLAFNPMHDVYIYETCKYFYSIDSPYALRQQLAGLMSLVQVLLAALFVVFAYTGDRQGRLRVKTVLLMLYSILTMGNTVVFASLDPPVGVIRWEDSWIRKITTYILGIPFVPMSLIIAVLMYYEIKSPQRGREARAILLLLLVTLTMFGFLTMMAQ
jgi:hypothetical protein